MRVLHVMATGELSGGVNHLLALVPALARLGVDVQVAAGTDGPLLARLSAQGIVTTPIELMRSRVSLRNVMRLAKVVRDAEVDVVHYHGTRAAFFGALVRRRGLVRPSVYTVHGLSYRKSRARPVFLGAEWLACRHVEHVISVSKPDLDDLIARRFVPPARGTHLPNPIDTTRFAPRDRLAARRALGLAPEGFLVGTVGRLVPGKAVHDLLNAAALCKQPVEVVVAGDGPERAALEQLGRVLSLPVTFLGARDDVPEVLAALDLFVLPSLWEGEPLALLEAMAMELPVVATATAGATALLSGVSAGTLVPLSDPKAMAAAIDTWVALPESDRRARGRTSRPLVASRDATTLAGATRGLYAPLVRSA